MAQIDTSHRSIVYGLSGSRRGFLGVCVISDILNVMYAAPSCLCQGGCVCVNTRPSNGTVIKEDMLLMSASNMCL